MSQTAQSSMFGATTPKIVCLAVFSALAVLLGIKQPVGADEIQCLHFQPGPLIQPQCSSAPNGSKILSMKLLGNGPVELPHGYELNYERVGDRLYATGKESDFRLNVAHFDQGGSALTFEHVLRGPAYHADAICSFQSAAKNLVFVAAPPHILVS